MTTVAILPISDVNGEKFYRAIAGDKYSVGKTAGQALDALTAQLDEIEFSTLLVIQSFRPDSFDSLGFVSITRSAIAHRCRLKFAKAIAPKPIFMPELGSAIALRIGYCSNDESEGRLTGEGRSPRTAVFDEEEGTVAVESISQVRRFCANL